MLKSDFARSFNRCEFGSRLSKRFLTIAGLALLTGLIATGCGREEPVSEAQRVEQGAPEEVVAKRAGQRWQSLIEQRFETAYEYLSPGHREIVDKEKYQQQLAGTVTNWKAADVQSVVCDGQVCEVKVSVRFEYLGPKGPKGQELTTVTTENWILQQGNWWYSRKRVRG